GRGSTISPGLARRRPRSRREPFSRAQRPRDGARLRVCSAPMSTGTTDLAGRNIVITGANTGIGRATAVALAARGAHVILACRSLEKTEPVVEAIRAAGGSVESVALDLGDLDQTRRCAE